MPFEAHLNRWRVARLVALAVALLLGGVRLAGGFGPIDAVRGVPPETLHVIGWIGIVFFGLGLVMMVPQLFQSGVEVRVDAEGVYGRRYCKRVIPWSAIERIATVDMGRIQITDLYLNDPENYPPDGVAGWIRRATRGLGTKTFGDVSVTLQNTDGNIADMRAAFDHFAPGRRQDPAA